MDAACVICADLRETNVSIDFSWRSAFFNQTANVQFFISLSFSYLLRFFSFLFFFAELLRIFLSSMMNGGPFNWYLVAHSSEADLRGPINFSCGQSPSWNFSSFLQILPVIQHRWNHVYQLHFRSRRHGIQQQFGGPRQRLRSLRLHRHTPLRR